MSRRDGEVPGGRRDGFRTRWYDWGYHRPPHHKGPEKEERFLCEVADGVDATLLRLRQ